MDLTPEKVFALLKSTEEFPVNFDDAWEWIGYARKSDAKSALLNAGFLAGEDFRILRNIPQNSKVGRPSEKIYLTIDCFKSFAMMAGTLRGKEVRRYFIDCENQLKDILRNRRNVQDVNDRLIKATQKLYILDEPVKWSMRGRVFQNEFYNQVYRLKNRSRPYGNHPIWMAQVTIDIVYRRLQPGIWEELCIKNPKINGRRRHCCHQFLTDNIGNPHLQGHLYAVTKLMKGSLSWPGFVTVLNQFHPAVNEVQMDLLFEFFAHSPEMFEDWKAFAASS